MNRQHAVYDIFESPLGTLFLIFSGKLLAGLAFEKPENISYKAGSSPEKFIHELTIYFNGSEVEFSQEVIFLKGTEFERRVWDTLKKIPFGETRSYKWVAEQTGSSGATRAVGRALSKNPIPVVVPCHRVIESDGSIGGYSSGVDIKRRLLDIEYYAKINS